MQGMPRRPEQASLDALKIDLTRDEQLLLCTALNFWGGAGAYATLDNWQFFTASAALAALSRSTLFVTLESVAYRDGVRVKVASAMKAWSFAGKAKSRVEVRRAKKRLSQRVNPLDIDRSGKGDEA
jgi:hypothetical protein